MRRRRADGICRLAPALSSASAIGGPGAGDAADHLLLLGLLQHHAFWAARCGGRRRRFRGRFCCSVLFVAAFYVAMNLAVLPSLRDAAAHAAESALVRHAAGGGDCALGVWQLGWIR